MSTIIADLRHMPRLDEWTPVFPVTGISIISHK